MARYVGIDPSTKMGYVVLDEQGNVLEAIEINRRGEDPLRMRLLIQDVVSRVQTGDLIAIEGFGFASQQAVQLGGIGWGIRMALNAMEIGYIEPAPSQVKKFTGAGGTAAKEQVAVATFKRWGFEHKSNNVTDAYVLAQIARAYHLPDVEMTAFQREVIEALRNPSDKKSKGKRAKAQ